MPTQRPAQHHARRVDVASSITSSTRPCDLRSHHRPAPDLPRWVWRVWSWF